MSKIGRQPIQIAAGASVEVNGREVKILGPKGTLVQKLPYGIEVEVKDGFVIVKSKGKSKQAPTVCSSLLLHL